MTLCFLQIPRLMVMFRLKFNKILAQEYVNTARKAAERRATHALTRYGLWVVFVSVAAAMGSETA